MTRRHTTTPCLPGRAPRANPSAAVPAPRTFDSQALFENTQQILIVHQAETYRLQITRQGKLILTK